MAYIPVADTVLLEMFQGLHGQKVENTLYFRLAGGMSVAQMTDLWNKMLTWWTVNLAPHLSNDLTLRGGKVTDLSTQSGAALDFNAPTPNPAGTVPSPSLPGNVACCVSIKTAARGRSFRGRNYIAGIAEASVVGNTLDLAVTVNVQAAYDAILTVPFVAPWEWVVVSRYANKLPRVTGVATAVTRAQVIDRNVDSMRTRLTGRGV